MGFYNRYELFGGYLGCGETNYGGRDDYDCDDKYEDNDYDYKDRDCGRNGKGGDYGRGGKDGYNGGYDDDYGCGKGGWDYNDNKREGRRGCKGRERCGCIPWQGKCDGWNRCGKDNHGGHDDKGCRPNKRQRCCCPICNFFNMFCCK